jgi:gamma-glutamyltranspeptidase/glutathione hydrolase
MQKSRNDQFDTEFVEPRISRVRSPQRLAFSKHGMASTAHYKATEAAVEMLSNGGNAMDAAVAAAFALGVCEPQASGLGGQTMMLVHIAETRQTLALDGSSRAPNRATAENISSKERCRGYKAATVPSTVAVLGYALQKYGTFTFDRVLEPAISLAKEGIEVSELQSALMKREAKKLRAGSASAIFLNKARRPWVAGTLLKQPVLAETLERLASTGAIDFYTGKIARLIHEDMAKNAGLIRDDDLSQVPWPIERKPLATRFNGLRLLTFPPPGAGRALIEMLHIIERFPNKLWSPDTPKGAVVLAEVMKRAALDRRDRSFGPDYYPQVEDKKMLRRDYAEKISKRIQTRIKAIGETTHLSIMDKNWNVVSLTQSIEGVFGSGVVTPELGFLYNNYLNAFDYEDISHPYYMRPNAVPWASVAPTIIFRNRKPWLAVGSPGSERIVSAIFQVILRLFSQSPYGAVAAPRLHCSVDGKASLEVSRFRDDIPRALESSGFEIDPRDAVSFYMGCVQLVQRERSGFIGVADPRRDGSAAGPRTIEEGL